MQTALNNHLDRKSFQKKPKWGTRLLFVFVAIFCVYHLIAAAYILRGVVGLAPIRTITEGEILTLDTDLSILDELIPSLRSVQTGITLVFWSKWVPVLGDYVEFADLAIDAIEDMQSIANFALPLALQVQETYEDGLDGLPEDAGFFSLSDGHRREILRAISTARDEYDLALLHLAQLSQTIQRISMLSVFPRFQDDFAMLTRESERLSTIATKIRPLVHALPAITGIDANEQWMVLFMNDNELRPGGGFIGMYALLETSAGAIVHFEANDTYEVDNLVAGDDGYQLSPPAPITEYLGVDKWYFRDANWSPDFAESAEFARTLYRQERSHGGQTIDPVPHVFAMTTDFAAKLLEFIGPIEAGGDTYTSDNLSELLEYTVQFGFKIEELSVEQRKLVVEELSVKVIERLLSLELSQYPELFEIMTEAISQKQVALYSTNDHTQQVFLDSEWAGTYERKEAEDFLMVVDANLGALKTNRHIQRDVIYTVTEENGRMRADVTVHYAHRGNFDLVTTRYRTFTRVFIPEGSEYISHDGSLRNDRLLNPEAAPDEIVIEPLESGIMSLGAFTAIEPNGDGTLTFSYYLPDDIDTNNLYRLNMPRQIGSGEDALTLQLQFDKNVSYALPGEDPEQFGDNRFDYEGVMKGDERFLVEF
ncbi:MAG: DUF4012 domain-containing protein [bacterium]|nr:DUF4012 domain-containing protein [bacterium]MDA1024604.1 DUF4012 domain-containing protein [bacterium]